LAEFVRVASTSDIGPGEGICVEVNGRAIALFNVNGQFFALDNSCAHRGGPLGEGFVDQANQTVQCPWHGWTYNLTTGASPINPMARVERFEVQVEGEEVRISLE
jgi:nitrite reductase/ring-hydroxylating ferredoxin subunit